MRIANALGTGNPIGDSLSGVVAAFLKGRGSMAQRAALEASARSRDALARLNNAKADTALSQRAGSSRIGDIFRAIQPQRTAATAIDDPAIFDPALLQDELPATTPAFDAREGSRSFFAGLPNELAAASAEAGGTMPQNIGALIRAAVANDPASTDSAIARAFAGAGGKLGKDDSLTVGRQDAIRTGNFAQETSINNADNRQSGLNTAADNTAAGERNAADNTQSGANNAADNEHALDVNENNIASALARAMLGNKSREFIANADRVVKAEKANKPPRVGFGDPEKIDEEIDARLGADVPLAASLKAGIRDLSIQLYQGDGPERGNPALSVGNAITQLVGKDGANLVTEDAPGFGFGFGADQRVLPAPSGVAGAVTSGGPAPSSVPPVTSPGIAQSIPPAPDRIVNGVYETPRGPMKWTGTGWVPAGV